LKANFYYLLKPHHRIELNNRLIDSGWSDYAGHREWLKSIDCEIAMSALGKYGASHRATFEERQQAEEYRRACGDELADQIEVNAKNLTATAQRASQYLADVIERQLKELSERELATPFEVSQAANTLSKLVSAIGTLNTSFVVQKKLADEIKAKLEARLDAMQSGDEKQGITLEFMNRIRTEVLGLE
jgi:ABC-type phosphate/phosphonate transport system substrate-binding protein